MPARLREQQDTECNSRALRKDSPLPLQTVGYGVLMVRVSAAVGVSLVGAIGLLVTPVQARPSSDILQLVQDRRPHQNVALPKNVSIQAMTAQRSDTVFAGSFGLGVFRSDDKGDTWIPSSSGITDPYILSLASGPDHTLYAGTFRGGAFRSRDGGRNWEAINTGLKGLQVKSLLMTKKKLYAGTGHGVYQFDVAHARWVWVTKGLDNTVVHCLVMAKDGTLYAGTSGKGIVHYKVASRGKAWERLSTGLVDHEGLGENYIRVLALDHTRSLYAGTFDGGVFQSRDGGQSWKPISRALPNDSIRGIVVNTKGIFVATGRGIFRKPHQERTWRPINQGLKALSTQTLIESPEGVLYTGTSSGAFRSDDDGGTWVSINTGLEGTGGSPFGQIRRRKE